MAKLNEETSIIRFPITNFKAHVVLTNSMEMSYETRRKLVGGQLNDEDLSDARAMVLYDENNHKEAFILLPWEYSPGTVAHEAFHCVERIFEVIGAKPESEMMAHHLEYIVDKITALYDKVEAREKELEKDLEAEASQDEGQKEIL